MSDKQLKILTPSVRVLRKTWRVENDQRLFNQSIPESMDCNDISKKSLSNCVNAWIHCVTKMKGNCMAVYCDNFIKPDDVLKEAKKNVPFFDWYTNFYFSPEFTGQFDNFTVLQSKARYDGDKCYLDARLVGDKSIKDGYFVYKFPIKKSGGEGVIIE